ncbi:PLP-dependent aminotransferase family protein [Frigidibacter mobilis]|uniref:GntR family transcriptional regulator n=1 Tax=Frigidibacter mobilis TaxID=1335048 RepID=A0A161GLQ3_9RHOB|nr:PLP-dependent aminotransferase family protein [Frigidibacter mobilis]AMY68323.1 GntR family transcriptional regulator [Frigidibacter mobilis]
MTNALRTTQVMDAIRRMVAERALLAGDRVPSIRSFAARMNVSPSTVVEAYDRLIAEGVIRSKPGSGFYVAGRTALKDLRAPSADLDRSVDPLWVSRQSLDAAPDVLKPGCGWMPPDWMPQASIRRALRQISHGGDALLADYGSSHGGPALRQILARQSAEEGLPVDPDMVLLTGSGSQTIDLICRLLLRPGDTVLVDDPCYFNFQALLRVLGVRIVPVPFTRDGPDLAAFAEALETHRPRLYLTNSALHNPTGATISAQTAHRLLLLAAERELMIVEDDTFAALEPDLSPRLAILDGLQRVIRIGSFSKTLSAAARCGYVMARPDLIEGLTDLQVATNFGGPSPVAAEIVRITLADGSYRKHIAATRTRLARARRDAAARLQPLGIEPWIMPRGGFYLWCHLPKGRSAQDLAKAALERKIVLAPGNVFSVAGTADGFIRLNASQMAPAVYDALAEALERSA